MSLLYGLFLALLSSVIGLKYSVHQINQIKINKSNMILFAKKTTDITGAKWSPDVPPLPTARWLSQRMDASWGKAKFRREVWDDNTQNFYDDGSLNTNNPANAWWEAYTPSPQEIEACEAKYTFGDPKAWFDEKGLNYEEAKAKHNAECRELVNMYYKEYEESTEFNEEEFNKVTVEFLALQNRAFELAFRRNDDRLQSLKGTPVNPMAVGVKMPQPSLEGEDTGVQWFNEKVVPK